MPHRKDAAHFLAFDLGAGSGRAVLGTLDGPKLTVHEVRRFPNNPLPLAGHIHWNVYALFDEMKAAMRDAAAAVGARPASLGVDTWGVDFGLLARDGSLLGLPFCYRDHRNAGAMEDYFKLRAPGRLSTKRPASSSCPSTRSSRSTPWSGRDRRSSTRPRTCSSCPTCSTSCSRAGRRPNSPSPRPRSASTPARRPGCPGSSRRWGSRRRSSRTSSSPGPSSDRSPRRSPPRPACGTCRSSPRPATIRRPPSPPSPPKGANWAYISSGTWSLVGVEETVARHLGGVPRGELHQRGRRRRDGPIPQERVRPLARPGLPQGLVGRRRPSPTTT